MSRIRLGGVKVFENRAYFSSLCRNADALDSLCSGLAAKRINMGLVTHLTDIRTGESMTAANARTAVSLEPFIHPNAGRSDCTGRVLAEVCRISIFPHDQRPEVTAALIGSLAVGGINPHCLATSPSAVTMVVSSSSLQVAVEKIFDAFSFPACDSYNEWCNACRVQESALQEVRCRYHEDVIHVYGLNLLDRQDLWNVSLPPGGVEDFGKALFELGELRFKMPFLLSNSSSVEGVTLFSLCLAAEHRERVSQILNRSLPGRDFPRLGPVSVLFLHGPHFGDRYGIASAVVNCLRTCGITTLALSCAVSSISLVVHSGDLDKTIEALGSTFRTPVA